MLGVPGERHLEPLGLWKRPRESLDDRDELVMGRLGGFVGEVGVGPSGHQRRGVGRRRGGSCQFLGRGHHFDHVDERATDAAATPSAPSTALTIVTSRDRMRPLDVAVLTAKRAFTLDTSRTMTTHPSARLAASARSMTSGAGVSVGSELTGRTPPAR